MTPKASELASRPRDRHRPALPGPGASDDAYAQLGHRAGDFPVAEALARECLSLPMFPGMTELQLTAVAEAVRTFFDG